MINKNLEYATKDLEYAVSNELEVSNHNWNRITTLIATICHGFKDLSMVYQH